MDWAENGSKAVDQFEASDPGSYFAIFMDMQMPVMDGIEATKKFGNSVREDNDVPIFCDDSKYFLQRTASGARTRAYSETGEFKRDSDDAGRESADGMCRITGRINNRKIWRRGSTALDCSGAFFMVYHRK